LTYGFGTPFAVNKVAMEADENTKNAVQQLVNAVQSSVNTSPIVATAIENLQFMGYVPNFTVRMDLELLRPSLDGLTDTKVRVC
jgi:hypothetical protein